MSPKGVEAVVLGMALQVGEGGVCFGSGEEGHHGEHCANQMMMTDGAKLRSLKLVGKQGHQSYLRKLSDD
jgi:hypothetical protein